MVEKNIEAEPIKIKGFKQFKFAVHNSLVDGQFDYDDWTVTELDSGAVVAFGRSKFDAMVKAQMKLKDAGEREIEEAYLRAMEISKKAIVN